MEMISNNPNITRAELALAIGKSKKTVERIIKNNPRIIFVGSSKAGHWEILSDDPNKNDN